MSSPTDPNLNGLRATFRELLLEHTMSGPGKQRFRVVIVGGSIAGLTLAHCLLRSGIDFVVLEARADVAPQEGASIGIMPNGSRILEQMGMLDDCLVTTAPLKRNFIWTDKGAPVLEDDSIEEMHKRHGYPVMFLDRQVVLQTLYNHLGSYRSQVHVNKKVVRVEHHSTHVLVHCLDGTAYEGDLVVGADGVHSKIRREMWHYMESLSLQKQVAEDSKTMLLEYSCIFGISTTPPGINVGDGHRTMGQDYAFVIMSGRKGRLYWFLFIKLDQQHLGSHSIRYTADDLEAHAARYLDKPAAGKVTFGEIYKTAVHKSFFPLEEACYKYWTKGRFVCIGDSVHKMTPNMGQGSNSAMESAALFTNCLTRLLQSSPEKVPLQTLESCLQDWQTRRRPRAEDMVTTSYHMIRVDTLMTWKHKIAIFYIMPIVKDFAVELATMAMIGAEKLDSVPVVPRKEGAVIPFVPNFDRLRLEPVRKWGLWTIAPLVGCYALSRLSIDPVAKLLQPLVGNILAQGAWTTSSGLLDLKAPLYYVPFLDKIVNPLVTRFLPAISGTDLLCHAQALSFVVDVGSVYGIWLLESYRQGQAWIDVVISSALGMSSQIEGLGRIAPWYCLYASFRTPLTRLLTGSNRTIEPATVISLLPAMLMGYSVGISSFSAPTMAERRSYNALWQLLPVVVPLIQAPLKRLVRAVSSTASPEAPEKNLKKKKSTSLLHLRCCYLTFAVISGLTFNYARSIAPTGSSFLSTFFPSPFLAANPISSFPEATSRFLQYNEVLGLGSGLVWLLLRFRELKQLGTPVSWWRVMGGLSLSTMALGPGATFALGWGWREEMLARTAPSMS
ncbi:putative monooxygenase [Aspergillus ellipticus CBS 707.79]|uniref:Putative monooxygenase n=1 Tax=Aspergillus ellipticus CBS 707.79 TaxID=1448320 RepID=A0A319DMC8_9EURO|nr:putative monooxygenase [Aspergillus ellipticus CBS 707.79]